MNVRKLLICLGLCLIFSQLTVLAEETTTNSETNLEQSVTPLSQSSNTVTGTSEETNQENSNIEAPSDTDETAQTLENPNLIVPEVTTEENAQASTDTSAEVTSVQEVVLGGQRTLPESYQTWINVALDPKVMPIDVLINGKYLKMSRDALVINNATYVPLRSVFEALGYKDIVFDAISYKMIVKGPLGEYQFSINTNEVTLNGIALKMERPTLIVGDLAMIPLRFISEQFKFGINFDKWYYTVNLVNTNYPVDANYLDKRFYSYEEFTTFSKLIMKEAGSVTYETKHGVASVVMNQYRDPRFPKTINGIIYLVGRYTNFPPAHKAGFLDTLPNRECILAAKKTLRGENSTGPCLFFNTRPFKGRTIFKVVDGVYFCY